MIDRHATRPTDNVKDSLDVFITETENVDRKDTKVKETAKIYKVEDAEPLFDEFGNSQLPSNIN